ncbi:MAG: aminotransferase class I/II-fold pyridoxal phosphate-dependent enzyme, partial [Candidatus Binataceae bacterium]
NSPTGSALVLDEAAAIVRECHRFRAGCVFDEAFIDFVDGGESAAHLLRLSPELVVVRSLTKIFAIPGLRLGFVVAAEDFAGHLRERLEPWSVNVVAERVALACLDGAGDFIRRTCEFVAAERAWLMARLGGLAGLHVFPSAANFLMLEVDETRENSGSGFAGFMMSRKIAVRDLRGLPGCTRGMYRIGLRTRREHERLASAIEAYCGAGAR